MKYVECFIGGLILIFFFFVDTVTLYGIQMPFSELLVYFDRYIEASIILKLLLYFIPISGIVCFFMNTSNKRKIFVLVYCFTIILILSLLMLRGHQKIIDSFVLGSFLTFLLPLSFFIPQKQSSNVVPKGLTSEPVAKEVPTFQQSTTEPIAKEVPTFQQSTTEPIAKEAPTFQQSTPEPVAKEVPIFQQSTPEPIAKEAPTFQQPTSEPVAIEAPTFQQSTPEPVAKEVPIFQQSTPEPVAKEIPTFKQPIPKRIVKKAPAFQKQVLSSNLEGRYGFKNLTLNIQKMQEGTIQYKVRLDDGKKIVDLTSSKLKGVKNDSFELFRGDKKIAILFGSKDNKGKMIVFQKGEKRIIFRPL